MHICAAMFRLQTQTPDTECTVTDSIQSPFRETFGKAYSACACICCVGALFGRKARFCSVVIADGESIDKVAVLAENHRQQCCTIGFWSVNGYDEICLPTERVELECKNRNTTVAYLSNPHPYL